MGPSERFSGLVCEGFRSRSDPPSVPESARSRRLGARPENLAVFLVASARDPWTLIVVAGYLVGFVLHAVAIWLLPAYPLIAFLAGALRVAYLVPRRGPGVALGTMIDMGVPKGQLAHDLKTLKDSAQLDGHHTEAAMIEMIMRNAGLR